MSRLKRIQYYWLPHPLHGFVAAELDETDKEHCDQEGRPAHRFVRVYAQRGKIVRGRNSRDAFTIHLSQAQKDALSPVTEKTMLARVFNLAQFSQTDAGTTLHFLKCNFDQDYFTLRAGKMLLYVNPFVWHGASETTQARAALHEYAMAGTPEFHEVQQGTSAYNVFRIAALARHRAFFSAPRKPQTIFIRGFIHSGQMHICTQLVRFMVSSFPAHWSQLGQRVVQSAGAVRLLLSGDGASGGGFRLRLVGSLAHLDSANFVPIAATSPSVPIFEGAPGTDDDLIFRVAVGATLQDSGKARRRGVDQSRSWEQFAMFEHNGSERYTLAQAADAYDQLREGLVPHILSATTFDELLGALVGIVHLTQLAHLRRTKSSDKHVLDHHIECAARVLGLSRDDVATRTTDEQVSLSFAQRCYERLLRKVLSAINDLFSAGDDARGDGVPIDIVVAPAAIPHSDRFGVQTWCRNVYNDILSRIYVASCLEDTFRVYRQEGLTSMSQFWEDPKDEVANICTVLEHMENSSSSSGAEPPSCEYTVHLPDGVVPLTFVQCDHQAETKTVAVGKILYRHDTMAFSQISEGDIVVAFNGDPTVAQTVKLLSSTIERSTVGRVLRLRRQTDQGLGKGDTAGAAPQKTSDEVSAAMPPGSHIIAQAEQDGGTSKPTATSQVAAPPSTFSGNDPLATFRDAASGNIAFTHRSGRYLYEAEAFAAEIKKDLSPPSIKSCMAAAVTNSTETCVAHTLRQQLGEVLSQVSLGDSYHIQCFTSNTHGQPLAFDGALVSRQAQSTLIEAASRLARIGFVLHMPIEDFMSRYAVLGPSQRNRKAGGSGTSKTSADKSPATFGAVATDGSGVSQYHQGHTRNSSQVIADSARALVAHTLGKVMSTTEDHVQIGSKNVLFRSQTSYIFLERLMWRHRSASCVMVQSVARMHLVRVKLKMCWGAVQQRIAKEKEEAEAAQKLVAQLESLVELRKIRAAGREQRAGMLKRRRRWERKQKTLRAIVLWAAQQNRIIIDIQSRYRCRLAHRKFRVLKAENSLRAACQSNDCSAIAQAVKDAHAILPSTTCSPYLGARLLDKMSAAQAYAVALQELNDARKRIKAAADALQQYPSQDNYTSLQIVLEEAATVGVAFLDPEAMRARAVLDNLADQQRMMYRLLEMYNRSDPIHHLEEMRELVTRAGQLQLDEVTVGHSFVAVPSIQHGMPPHVLVDHLKAMIDELTPIVSLRKRLRLAIELVNMTEGEAVLDELRQSQLISRCAAGTPVKQLLQTELAGLRRLKDISQTSPVWQKLTQAPRPEILRLLHRLFDQPDQDRLSSVAKSLVSLHVTPAELAQQQTYFMAISKLVKWRPSEFLRVAPLPKVATIWKMLRSRMAQERHMQREREKIGSHDEWIIKYTVRTHLPYYVNRVTGATSWHAPPENAESKHFKSAAATQRRAIYQATTSNQRRQSTINKYEAYIARRVWNNT